MTGNTVTEQVNQYFPLMFPDQATASTSATPFGTSASPTPQDHARALEKIPTKTRRKGL